MGTHKHKCAEPGCGRVWQHPDNSSREAHFCPDCGACQTLKYFGPEEPGDKGRGIRAIGESQYAANNPANAEPK